jgi:hypothetical protein
LKKIGIDQNEITRRGLSIHSWRHFLNTELQTQGLTLNQVQAVTGHKSDRMSEWYNHFDARQLSMVMDAQEVIVGGKKPGKSGQGANAGNGTVKQAGRTDLKIVKLPERKEA